MKSRILETREDRFYQRSQDVLGQWLGHNENWCCQGRDVTIDFMVAKTGRFWVFYCAQCGKFLDDWDAAPGE